MIKKETAIYSLEPTQIYYFFCIHVHKFKVTENICKFVYMVIQKINKSKRISNRVRFASKKTKLFFSKKDKVVGLVCCVVSWTKRFDGGGFRADKNLALTTKKDKLKNLLTNIRLKFHEPYRHKILGGVPEDIKRQRIKKYFPLFQKLYFRFY